MIKIYTYKFRAKAIFFTYLLPKKNKQEKLTFDKKYFLLLKIIGD